MKGPWSRLAASAAVLLIGCAHIGPGTVVNGRFDFSTAIAESWKEQTVLLLFTLTDSGAGQSLPILTIPTD